MTRMFGRCPDGAGCACACVTAIGDLDARPTAVAAASVLPPSRMLRRLSALPSRSAPDFPSGVSLECLSLVPIVLSPLPRGGGGLRNPPRGGTAARAVGLGAPLDLRRPPT